MVLSTIPKHRYKYTNATIDENQYTLPETGLFDFERGVRAQIAWSDVSLLQRVHVLVLEHHTQLTAFGLWASQHDAQQLCQLMHQRGVVWDRNTLMQSTERCYLPYRPPLSTS